MPKVADAKHEDYLLHSCIELEDVALRMDAMGNKEMLRHKFIESKLKRQDAQLRNLRAFKRRKVDPVEVERLKAENAELTLVANETALRCTSLAVFLDIIRKGDKHQTLREQLRFVERVVHKLHQIQLEAGAETITEALLPELTLDLVPSPIHASLVNDNFDQTAEGEVALREGSREVVTLRESVLAIMGTDLRNPIGFRDAIVGAFLHYIQQVYKQLDPTQRQKLHREYNVDLKAFKLNNLKLPVLTPKTEGAA